MLTDLMYVTINVTDQDRALRFYTEGLGLEKRADHTGPDGRFLTVGLPGRPVEILLWARPDTAALGSLFLESGDLREDFAAMRARGVRFEQPEPEDYPFGVRIEAIDPDGNRIALRQRHSA